ncbi:MAG: hypothetical protein AB8I08_16490 [Sandaracinaceae bacterium]
MKRIVSRVSLLVVLVGCGPGEDHPSSSELPTSAMRISMALDADGSGRTHVEVNAYIDSGGWGSVNVELTDGDRFRAYAPHGDSAELGVHHEYSNVDYRAQFDDDMPGGVFRVAFEREAEESAPVSEVEMPEPFEITSPEPGRTFGYEDRDVVLQWAPRSSDPIDIFVRGECFEAIHLELDDDPGTVRLSDLFQMDGVRSSAPCEAVARVRRTRGGSVDPAYEGGSIRARQVRTVAFRSEW